MKTSSPTSSSSKTCFTVAGGLVAVGIVLMLAGFVLSGFNPTVFSATIDGRTHSFQLGGQEVENPDELPLLGSFFRTFGSVDVDPAATQGSPSAPSAPAAPAAAAAPSESAASAPAA